MNKKLKSKLKQFKWIMIPYRKIRNIYDRRKLKIKIQYFENNSITVVEAVQKTLSQSEEFFFFDMGTLLGIYRDGRLIKRDMDIDVGIRINSMDAVNALRSKFKENGFRHKYIFSTEKYGIIQDTYDYEGVTVDICYYREEDSKDICYLLYDNGDEKNLIIKLSCHHIQRIESFVFHNIKINIPCCTEQYLSDRYGTNWRIPDSRYVYWKGPSAEKVEGLGTIEHLRYEK